MEQLSKYNISPNENPTRRQSSLGSNVRLRDGSNLDENYGIFLAKVTRVYYSKGTLDFDARDTLENLVNTSFDNGLGKAQLPVELFGTNADGKVYGNYRPVNVGDTVAIAYLGGNRRDPIVLGVYPKNSDSYELVSPVDYTQADGTKEATQKETLAERKIYPSQQLYYQSGKGDIFRSLGGHSFLALTQDDYELTRDIDYAYDATSAFYNNNGEQLQPQETKAQAWLLVHEDNPDSADSDGHRTRFYVAPNGEMQIVFTNDNTNGILILEGSLDKGFTIKKQYDTSIIEDDDAESNEYVTLNVGGETGFSLDVHNVSGSSSINPSAKLTKAMNNATKFAVKSDDVYVNDTSLTDLIGENADDIQHIIDKNQKYNKEYFNKLDKDTKQAGQIARNAARDAHEAGAHAKDAGEQAKATSRDIKDRIMYYMNISPEEDVYVPNKYLIIHTDTFIEDATIKQGMIDDLAVGTAQIAYEAVGTAEIEDLAVSSGKIDNLAVTDEKVGHLTFDHMIGEQIDANTIDVVNLHGDNITAGTITADKILINGLGDLSHHLGDITDGHIQSGDNGVIIDDLPADDPDQWTPAKKALLKQQIGILEAEANATIQYGDNVGLESGRVETAKEALISGTASLLTDMAKTERFSNSKIQTWISDLKNAVEDFMNEANDTLIKKVGTTESGNNIYQGPEEPDVSKVHLGDIWFKEYEKDGKTTYEQLVYGNDGWYSPSDYNVTQIQEQLDKLPTPYYQADEPQGDIKKDDTWYKTSTDSNGNVTYTAYKYNGKDWQPLLDNNASKNTSGTSAPANPHKGDFWTDESTKELKQWNGNGWTVIPTQGPQGVPGKDGKGGVSSYFHVAYADDAQGNGFTQDPGNKKYMGTYVDDTQADSIKPEDYVWNKIQGNQGKDGTDGIPGKDGTNGKTSYLHLAYADDDKGSGFSQTPNNKKYLGQYVDFTQKDSIKPSDYTWSLIKGSDGQDGADGVPGKDGVSNYIHTAYANSKDGKNGFSTDYFAGASYIGIVTNYDKADPTRYTDYNWSRMTGEDGTNGTDGAPGKNGKDGTTYYVHFAYSNSADGKDNFSTSEFKDALYVGILSDTTKADSTTYSDYTWSRLRGQDGSNGHDGIPGSDGKDGKSSYIHIAYANSSDGSTGFSTSDATNKKYIGTYTDTTQADSTDNKKYNWSLIKGQDGTNGTDGVDGKPGADGRTTYVHFAYANSSDGKDKFSTTYFANAVYVGTLTDYTQKDSTTYSDYTWSRLRGQDGATGPAGTDGTDGKNGTDGKTYYTWIKFATSESGANISDNPKGMSYIGIAYNKPTATESSVPTDYTWTKIKGEDGKNGTNGKNGQDGIQGPKGSDGKDSYTWIKYADSPTTGMSDNSDGKQFIGISTNHDTATESNNYEDYSWARLWDASKKRNFTDTPTTPYDVGDTWTQSGATLYCIKARQSGAFSASDWNTQQITLTSLDTALQQQVKAGTDAKDGLDNLQVGGRNLIIASETEMGYVDTNGTITKNQVNFSTGWIKVIPNTAYTLSADPASGVYIRVGYYDKDKTFVKRDLSPKDTKVMTITIPNDIMYIRAGFDNDHYKEPYKIEKGTKATDWTPAPEDLVSQHKDYKGVTINENGLTADAGSTQVALNSSDGFLIKKGSSTLFNADTSGNLNMQGNITAGNISGVNFTGNNLTLAGSLKTTGSLSSGNGKVTLSNTGLNIKGAGLTIGDSSGKTTTMISDDGTFTANKAVLSGSLTSNSVNITGGTINMNGGKFSVDRSGNVTAKSFTADSLINKGTIDFSNLSVKNLSADNIVGGTITSSAMDVVNDTNETIINKYGITQINNDNHYNAIYNSEFTNNAESWDIGENNNSVDAYLSNLQPTIDGSNRIGTNINRLGKTYSAGYHTFAESTPVEIPAGATVTSVGVSLYCLNDWGGINYDYIQINVLYFDKDLKQVGTYNAHLTNAQATKYNDVDYIKNENNTIPSSAKYVSVSFGVKAPSGGGGIGHILFTQPMLCFDSKIVDYIPSSVSSNQSVDLKSGYISFISNESFTIPDYFTNITSYKGPVVQDGKVTLSSGGLEMNEQVHDPNSANTNYFGSTKVDHLGYSTTISDNYNNETQDVTARADVGFITSYRKKRADSPQFSQLMPAMITLNAGSGDAVTQIDSAGVYLGKGQLQLRQNANNSTAFVNMNNRLDMGIHPNDAQPTDKNSAKQNILMFYDSGHSTSNGDAILASNAVFARHYSSGQKVTVTNYCTLGRITSASKYKVGISEMPEIENKAHAFLAVKPKQWHDAGAVEEFANSLSDGVEPETHDGDLHVTPGFIAEDLYTAGLDEYVDRGADGSLEGIEYDRLPTLHHVLIQELFQRVNELENKFEKIERS